MLLEEGNKAPEFSLPNSDGEIVSLSDFTFPHEMATLILIEQIYRAISIKKKSKLSFISRHLEECRMGN